MRTKAYRKMYSTRLFVTLTPVCVPLHRYPIAPPACHPPLCYTLPSPLEADVKHEESLTPVPFKGPGWSRSRHVYFLIPHSCSRMNRPKWWSLNQISHRKYRSSIKTLTNRFACSILHTSCPVTSYLCSTSYYPTDEGRSLRDRCDNFAC